MSVNNSMPSYKIITQVDITRTEPNRDNSDTVLRAQQSNFNSLIQGIELRANVFWDQDPIMVEGETNTWHWLFTVEREEVFNDGDNPVGLLLEDLNNIPIINHLPNTPNLTHPAFKTRGANRNTWVILSE
jgi:hypothetical protein